MIPEEVYKQHKKKVRILRICQAYVLEYVSNTWLSDDEENVLYAFWKWLKRKEDL